MIRIDDLKGQLSRLGPSTRKDSPGKRVHRATLELRLQALERKRDAEVAERCLALFNTCMSRGHVTVACMDRLSVHDFKLDAQEPFRPIRPTSIRERTVGLPCRLTRREIARFKKDLWELAHWSVEGAY